MRSLNPDDNVAEKNTRSDSDRLTASGHLMHAQTVWTVLPQTVSPPTLTQHTRGVTCGVATRLRFPTHSDAAHTSATQEKNAVLDFWGPVLVVEIKRHELSSPLATDIHGTWDKQRTTDNRQQEIDMGVYIST